MFLKRHVRRDKLFLRAMSQVLPVAGGGFYGLLLVKIPNIGLLFLHNHKNKYILNSFLTIFPMEFFRKRSMIVLKWQDIRRISMNTVIKRISEIEDAASSLMESANEKKKAFAEEMRERTKEFDQNLKERTEQGIQELRKRMEVEMDKRLERQRLDAEEQLKKMEQRFENEQEDYVEKLFGQLIKE